MAAPIVSAVRLTDTRTKTLIAANPDIKLAKVLGSGSFSKVFDAGPGSVIKVTVDRTHLSYLNLPLFESPYRPRVIGSPELMGTIKGGHKLFCQKLEKLIPLKRGSVQYQKVSRVCRIINKFIHNTAPGCGPEVTRQILQELSNSGTEASLIEYLSRVFIFDSILPMAEFDFTPRNFMLRPGTNELVISDPVFDLDTILKVRGITASKKKLGYKTESRWAQ